MDNKQRVLLGAMAVLGTVATQASAQDVLSQLNVETVANSARGTFCPYGMCEVFLTDAEEKAISENVAKLNALNVIAVSGLTRTHVQTSPYCYNLPCHEEMVAAQAERRAKAAKLEAMVESVETLK